MLEFVLKKEFDGRLYLDIFKDKRVFDFKQKLTGRYKNIVNVLKKFPKTPLGFDIKEMPILEFLDEVVYEKKRYRVYHNLHILTFDYKNFFIDDKEVQFLTNEYVIAEDGIYKIYYVDDIEKNFSSDSVDSNYLSLLFSNFDRLYIKDYELNYHQEIYPKEAIFFEEVLDKNLVFRVDGFIEGIDIELFLLSKVAFLNGKVIDLFDLSLEPIDRAKDRFRRFLRKEKIEHIVENEHFILPQESVQHFLSHLPKLSQEYEIFGNRHLKDFNLQVVKPSLHVRIDRGVDLLELDGEVEIDSVKIPLREFLKQYRRSNYISLKNQNYIINSEYLKKLQRILRQDGEKTQVSFFDLPQIEQLVANKDQAVFKKSKEFFEGLNKLHQMPLDVKLNAKLRDYQIYGIKWMKYLKKHHFDDNKILRDIKSKKALQQRIEDIKSLAPFPKNFLDHFQKLLDYFKEIRVISYHVLEVDSESLERLKRLKDLFFFAEENKIIVTDIVKFTKEAKKLGIFVKEGKK